VPGVLLQQLGEGVGGIEGQRVLDGGLHALSAAIELAEQVLASGAQQSLAGRRHG